MYSELSKIWESSSPQEAQPQTLGTCSAPNTGVFKVDMSTEALVCPDPSYWALPHQFHSSTPPRITAKPTCPQGTPGALTVGGRRGNEVQGGWVRIILVCGLEGFLEEVEIKRP